jgi:very-short-patch-repair endonuclease
MKTKKYETNHNAFLFICKAQGIEGIVPEFMFAAELKRKWRFDFAIPEAMLAIEIEGGLWITGRHNRASGFVKDMEKYNTAATLGWRVLKFTPQEIQKDSTYQTIKKCLETKA